MWGTQDFVASIWGSFRSLSPLNEDCALSGFMKARKRLFRAAELKRSGRLKADTLIEFEVYTEYVQIMKN